MSHATSNAVGSRDPVEPLAPDGPCADASLGRGEPMAGTASRFDVWLFLDCGARSALELRAMLPPQVLERNLEAFHRRQRGEPGVAVRTLAMRSGASNPRSPSPVPMFVAVPERRTLHRASLSDLAALAEFDAEAFWRGDQDVDAEPIEGPIYGVCTDGKVDPCCAREGMSIYRDLEGRVDGRALRVSHLGGCRFASNLVTLPDGLLYGRIAHDQLDRLIAATEDRHILPECYRGRATLNVEENAAEIMLREELDEWRIDALQLESPVEADDDLHVCTFRHEGNGVHTVRFRRRPGIEARLTCRAEVSQAPVLWERVGGA